jgi:hypothetical protein
MSESRRHHCSAGGYAAQARRTPADGHQHHGQTTLAPATLVTAAGRHQHAAKGMLVREIASAVRGFLTVRGSPLRVPLSGGAGGPRGSGLGPLHRGPPPRSLPRSAGLSPAARCSAPPCRSRRVDYPAGQPGSRRLGERGPHRPPAGRRRTGRGSCSTQAVPERAGCASSLAPQSGRRRAPPARGRRYESRRSLRAGTVGTVRTVSQAVYDLRVR